MADLIGMGSTPWRRLERVKCLLRLPFAKTADNQWHAQKDHHNPYRVMESDKSNVKTKNQSQQRHLIETARDKGHPDCQKLNIAGNGYYRGCA
jgi:hypothetical protein